MSRFRLFLLLCWSVLAPAPLPAVVLTLNPVADAFVTTGPSNSLVNNNYGLAGALSLSAPGLPKGEFQSLLRFDLAAAVASFNSTFGVGMWTIDGVTLKLTSAIPNNPIFNGNGSGPGGSHVNIGGQFAIQWMQNDNWNEGTGRPMTPTTDGVTFSSVAGLLSAVDASLGTFSFNGTTSGATTWTLALNPSFTGDIATGGSVSLRLLAADTAVSYTFNSAHFVMDDSVWPVLSVSAVVIPEPGTAALLATAVLVLSRRRHRRCRVLADWLTSEKGRTFLLEYGRKSPGGIPLFYPTEAP